MVKRTLLTYKCLACIYKRKEKKKIEALKKSGRDIDIPNSVEISIEGFSCWDVVTMDTQG